jgi:alanine-synthesizing transaminase
MTAGGSRVKPPLVARRGLCYESGVTNIWSFPRADALPTYAFLATDAVKKKVVATGADLIDLGLGNPDKPTPKPIVEQLHASADIGKNHRYHPGRGLPALRQAMSSWYERRYHAKFDPETKVLVTMGAKEGISHLCLAILDRGDTAIVPDPCYPIHQHAPIIAGASVTSYPVKEGLEPAKAIADALESVKKAGGSTKLVLANYPHNPTGYTITKEALKDVVQVTQKAGVLLLHDAAYADLDFKVRFAPSIFDCGLDPKDVEKTAVEVFSMSKSYNMPGWRIAFMVGNERMVGALAHLKTYMDYGTFMPLQFAAAWALDNGDSLVDEIRALYQARATTLCKGLAEADWGAAAEPHGSMFVWTRLPKKIAHLTSADAATWLVENAHVAVSPGTGFGPGGEGFVRFALIEDPPRVAEACQRIKKALAV